MLKCNQKKSLFFLLTTAILAAKPKQADPILLVPHKYCESKRLFSLTDYLCFSKAKGHCNYQKKKKETSKLWFDLQR